MSAKSHTRNVQTSFVITSISHFYKKSRGFQKIVRLYKMCSRDLSKCRNLFYRLHLNTVCGIIYENKVYTKQETFNGQDIWYDLRIDSLMVIISFLGDVVMAATLGQKIRQLRKRNGLTQAALAQELGVSSSAVGMYEQDRRTPDNETLLVICNIFGVSTDYMLGNTENMTDVSVVLDDFNKRLTEYNALMFDGRPLTDEERKQVFDTIEYVARLAERLEYE